MIEYRIRTFFRIMAWLPGLFFCALGIGLMVVGYRAMSAGQVGEVLTILIGLVTCVPGSLFLRVAWTGRVPASVEEYGLDGPGEVEWSRSEARREGRLKE